MHASLVREPLYQQLNQTLRDRIRGGDFAVGTQFWTEREISAQFAVSRVTANKALASLVGEGLLEFRKGVGTFVRGEALKYNLRALISFAEQARTAGKTASTRLLDFSVRRAREGAPCVQQQLGVGPEDELWYLVRLRLADDVPVILERRYVIKRLWPEMRKANAKGSLTDAWSNREGAPRITGADEIVRAINISATDARLLAVRPGSAGLLVKVVGYAARARPLWWEQSLYRGDAYEFHNPIGGVEPARPAFRVLRLGTMNDALSPRSAVSMK